MLDGESSFGTIGAAGAHCPDAGSCEHSGLCPYFVTPRSIPPGSGTVVSSRAVREQTVPAVADTSAANTLVGPLEHIPSVRRRATLPFLSLGSMQLDHRSSTHCWSVTSTRRRIVEVVMYQN